MLVVSVLWVSALSITVEGNTNCPDPGDVAARLQAVAPASRIAGKALLSESEGALRVQLVRANGSVVGERLLDSRYPCGELADAAALVLASWQGEFDAAPVKAPSLRAVEVKPPTRSNLGLQFGLGLVAAGPRPLSAGGSLSVGVNKGAWGLGFQLIATDFHRQPIDGGGEISWNRSPVTLTARRRFQSSTGLVLALDAGVAGAALFSRGQGPEVNLATASFDFGPSVGGQLLYNAGQGLLPFLGISTVLWLQPREVKVSSINSRFLPQVDSWFVLGLCWRLDER